MALTVTEEWIRERVGLKHKNLEDVRSLSLPGTYHEKINGLGDSMRQFSRLKSLDLSRNALEGLSGIESLKLLEKLNVYYNNISTLQELYRLRYNPNLQELDLRLNPVARNEPDYRLFLIHMLPNLRRLDDRAVRDSERKAALMHFSTDQANELTQHPPKQQEAPPQPNPRVQQVQQLGKPPAILDEDDTRVFEYLNPDRNTLTGSRAKEAAVEEYQPETLRQMNMAGVGLEFADPVADPPLPQLPHAPSSYPLPPTQAFQPLPPGVDPLSDLQAKYPNLATLPAEGEGSRQQGFDLHPDQPSLPEHKQNGDPNLKYTDEIEAYTSYKAQGHFTPNPGEEAPRPAVETPSSERAAELYTAEDLEKDLQKLNHSRSKQQQEIAPPEADRSLDGPLPVDGGAAQAELPGDFGEAIGKVSDLVDKYWNGSRSLLKSIRFKNHMVALLKDFRRNISDSHSVSSMASTNASLEFEMSRLRHSLDKSRKENEDLKEKLFQGVAVTDNIAAMDENKLKQSLIRSQRDVKLMKERLAKCMDENRALQERLSAGGEGSGASQAHAAGGGAEIGSIARENDTLRQQINTLSIRLKQSDQMSELACMLQQSHKSLVTTNDHLLKEMEETKKRHKEQMQHMTSSYNQLRRHVMPQVPQAPAQAQHQAHAYEAS